MLRFPITRKRRTNSRTSKLILSLSALLLVGVLAFPFLLSHDFRFAKHPDWNPIEVRVIGTRIVTVGAKDANEVRPATFFYRAEAEVQYQMNGKDFDVWLPASKNTSNETELKMWLSDKKGRFAIVEWNPKFPGQGEVKLKSDIGSTYSKFD